MAIALTFIFLALSPTMTASHAAPYAGAASARLAIMKGTPAPQISQQKVCKIVRVIAAFAGMSTATDLAAEKTGLASLTGSAARNFYVAVVPIYVSTLVCEMVS